MSNQFPRRVFVRAVPALGLLPFFRNVNVNANAQEGPAWPAPLVLPPPVDEAYPSHTPALAKEIVGVAHANLARVRELVAKYPALVKAGWDWGFGDWETPLGSASHVGNRPIAELLIENGATPTIFSAAMLGQLDVVKAFAAAVPNVHTLRGPHSISLLAHAKAGGANAAAVVGFVESLGADQALTNEPVSAADQKALSGAYSFGSHPRDRLIVDSEREQLGITRVGAVRRHLFHLGAFTFHPPGAPTVRIRFERTDDRVTTVTITDGDLVVKAVRVA